MQCGGYFSVVYGALWVFVGWFGVELVVVVVVLGRVIRFGVFRVLGLPYRRIFFVCWLFCVGCWWAGCRMLHGFGVWGGLSYCSVLVVGGCLFVLIFF